MEPAPPARPLRRVRRGVVAGVVMVGLVSTGLVIALSPGADSRGPDQQVTSVEAAVPPFAAVSEAPTSAPPGVPTAVRGQLLRPKSPAQLAAIRARDERRAREQRQQLRRAQRAERLRRAAAKSAALTEANPLAGRRWGVYQGPGDQAWAPYAASAGATRTALAEIALRPKAKWFGAWIPDSQIEANLRDYIANAQAGDPDALVQMAFFRVQPWEHEACSRLPSAAEQASYRDWTDRAARAIGETHAAIILQPDGPFALCVPGGSQVPSQLIGYAAKVLSALPNTSVYLDAGAGDWPAAGQGGVDEAVRFLLPAGIEYARGIALNSTHYSATDLEVARGAAIVQALEARGIRDKHVVVNTSNNGHPFPFGRYDGPDPDNARVCRSPSDPQLCVTLGIPPTTDVADARWGLSPQTDALARRYVDAYLWFGRPWLYRQNDPFQLDRALGLVASSPY